ASASAPSKLGYTRNSFWAAQGSAKANRPARASALLSVEERCAAVTCTPYTQRRRIARAAEPDAAGVAGELGFAIAAPDDAARADRVPAHRQSLCPRRCSSRFERRATCRWLRTNILTRPRGRLGCPQVKKPPRRGKHT